MRAATCCPDKPVVAKGLCGLCYSRSRAAYFKAYKKENPTSNDAWQVRKHDPVQKARDVQVWKWKALKRNYGLDKDTYLVMLAEQNYACKVCRRLFSDLVTDKKRTPENVDHCHSSGQVRGILCHNCNAGLGHFRDSPDLMRLAAQYIETTKAPQTNA